MASQREKQQEETHFKVMRLLDEDPSISTREIARRVGISNGAAHYCITALIQMGFIKLRNFTQSKKKANYIYELHPVEFVPRLHLPFHFSSARGMSMTT